jgi:hypothetical protein
MENRNFGLSRTKSMVSDPQNRSISRTGIVAQIIRMQHLVTIRTPRGGTFTAFAEPALRLLDIVPALRISALGNPRRPYPERNFLGNQVTKPFDAMLIDCVGSFQDLFGSLFGASLGIRSMLADGRPDGLYGAFTGGVTFITVSRIGSRLHSGRGAPRISG